MRAHLDDIDFDVVAAYERRFRHDVMAHVHAFGDVAPAARGFIHYGATSAFVTDNADLILMRRGLELLRGKIVHVLARARDVRARMARRADARLHASAARAADDGRQARDAVDAGSRARSRRSRSSHRDAALPRRERHDGHAGELPRDLRRRSRQGARARRARHARRSASRRRFPSRDRRTRASSTRRCSASSPASRRAR